MDSMDLRRIAAAGPLARDDTRAVKAAGLKPHLGAEGYNAPNAQQKSREKAYCRKHRWGAHPGALGAARRAAFVHWTSTQTAAFPT